MGRPTRPPFDVTVIKGSAILLSAPTSTTVDGFPYTWASWSDGKARSPHGDGVHLDDLHGNLRRRIRRRAAGRQVPPRHRAASSREGITVGCSDRPGSVLPERPRHSRADGDLPDARARPALRPRPTTSPMTRRSTHEATINRLRGGRHHVRLHGRRRFCPNGVVTRGQMASFLVAGVRPARHEHRLLHR